MNASMNSLADSSANLEMDMFNAVLNGYRGHQSYSHCEVAYASLPFSTEEVQLMKAIQHW